MLEIQSICDEQLGVISELKGTPFVQPPLRISFQIKLLEQISFFLVEPPTALQHDSTWAPSTPSLSTCSVGNLQQLTNMFNDPSRRNHHTGLGLSQFSSGDALSISHWFVINDLSMGILKWIGFTFTLVGAMPNMPCFAFSVLIIATISFNLPTQEEYGKFIKYESLTCCQHWSIPHWEAGFSDVDVA